MFNNGDGEVVAMHVVSLPYIICSTFTPPVMTMKLPRRLQPTATAVLVSSACSAASTVVLVPSPISILAGNPRDGRVSLLIKLSVFYRLNGSDSA